MNRVQLVLLKVQMLLFTQEKTLNSGLVLLTIFLSSVGANSVCFILFSAHELLCYSTDDRHYHMQSTVCAIGLVPPPPLA